jgi:hypothetical protein
MTVAERSFARVETALKGYVRLLPQGRFTPLFNGVQATIQPKLSDPDVSGLPDALMQFLNGMNEKLNTVLSLLSLQSLQEDFPHAVHIHDISGAGIRFSAAREFELGQALEAVIILGGQPQALAGATGVIIRAEEHLGQRVWAMEFKETRDSEREKIIQYVVAQQREQLRERRSSPSS